MRVLGGREPTIFGLAPLSGGNLSSFFLGAIYNANYIVKGELFFLHYGPARLFLACSFPLAIYSAYRGEARTAN